MSEKKIIIDEDWKTQVQAEKEAAAKQAPGEAATATGKSTAASQPTASVHGDIPMPPASLELLITTLATEALVALGAVPHPATGELQAHRGQAQYLIDTIDMLREKTKGNLTPDEQLMIESVLHQLRLVFVETAARPPAAPA